MGRTRFKGPMIGLRLPVGVDEAVRRRAEADGVSVGVYLAQMIVRTVSPGGEPPPRAPKPVRTRPSGGNVTPLAAKRAERLDESNMSTARHPSSACEHKNRTSLAGGMARCSDCGRIRGANGAWR